MIASTDAASFNQNMTLFQEWPLVPLADGRMCSPKLLKGVLLPIPEQEPKSELSLCLELLQSLKVINITRSLFLYVSIDS